MNSRGFVVSFLLILLPGLLAVVFAISWLLGFFMIESKVTTLCLKNQIELQELSKTVILRLFKLNPKAKKLRAQYALALKRHQVALASGNPAAIAVSRAQLDLVFHQRQLLGLEQRTEIQTVNNRILSSLADFEKNLIEQNQIQRASFQSFLDIKIEPLTYKKTRLAVEPVDLDVAPVYQLTKNFIEDQTMSFSWRLQINSDAVTRHFFAFKQNFTKGCATTINSKEVPWTVVLKRDKSF